jgi:uncharacterized protein (DUF1499 family)
MAGWQLGLVILGCLVLAVVIVLASFSIGAKKPTNLGVTSGRLAPCPNKPNCVCSQDSESLHRIEPLRYQGMPQEAMARLHAVLNSWPRTQVVTATDDYVHAECTSLVFRFVDDVEFLLDRTQGVIHCRSASRAGHSDFGVNRSRIEALRQAFQSANGGR